MKILDYPFTVRPGVIAHLYLPSDITREEVERLTEFMRVLVPAQEPAEVLPLIPHAFVPCYCPIGSGCSAWCHFPVSFGECCGEMPNAHAAQTSSATDSREAAL